MGVNSACPISRRDITVLLPGVLLIAFWATPFLLTVAALVMWRKTLVRPWVFGVFGFLAITGLQYLVRPLAEFLTLPSFASHTIIVRDRSGEVDLRVCRKAYGSCRGVDGSIAHSGYRASCRAGSSAALQAAKRFAAALDFRGLEGGRAAGLRRWRGGPGQGRRRGVKKLQCNQARARDSGAGSAYRFRANQRGSRDQSHKLARGRASFSRRASRWSSFRRAARR